MRCPAWRSVLIKPVEKKITGRVIGKTGGDIGGQIREQISGRIKAGGPITFAEFMEAALYTPGYGYYASGRSIWGERACGGDYVTNPDLSPVFARTLATQFHEMWTQLGSPKRFDLIEAGAGRGLLIKGVLEAATELYPDFSEALKAHAVERAGAPEDGADEKEGIGGKSPGEVTWHASIEELKAELRNDTDAPVTGCVFSNELIDALPFHRVVQRAGGTSGGAAGGLAGGPAGRLAGGPAGGSSGELKEVFVGLSEDGSFVDHEGEPSTEALLRYFSEREPETRLHVGQHAEASLLALEWIGEAASLLDRGFVLTIDYGMPGAALYAPGRQGTLLCHFRHTTNQDPYRAVGAQDITAHVDFTALKDAGLRAGLHTTGFSTQGSFLLGLGILDKVADTGGPNLSGLEALKLNQGIKALVLPGGPGDTFKVLCQHKGVSAPSTLLKGFSLKNLKDSL